MKKILMFLSFLLGLILISNCCGMPTDRGRERDRNCTPRQRRKGRCHNMDQKFQKQNLSIINQIDIA